MIYNVWPFNWNNDEESLQHQPQYDVEEAYGSPDETGDFRVMQIPIKVVHEERFHNANRSLSPEIQTDILKDIDDICTNQSVLSLRIEDMDKIIWQKHVILTDGKHPLLKKSEQNVSFDVVLSNESEPIISKSLRDLLPNQADKQVWIQEIDIIDITCNYPESIEIKTEEPQSEWACWRRTDEQVEECPELVTFNTKCHTMLNTIVQRNPEATDIPRNRTWALFVAGTDWDSLVVRRIGHDKVMIKRNLAVELMLETLRTAELPREIARSLNACAVQNDGKHFKISTNFFEYLKDITKEPLKVTKFLDTKFFFRRFDEGPWTDQKDMVINFSIQMKLAIFYRFFSNDEKEEEL